MRRLQTSPFGGIGLFRWHKRSHETFRAVASCGARVGWLCLLLACGCGAVAFAQAENVSSNIVSSAAQRQHRAAAEEQLWRAQQLERQRAEAERAEIAAQLRSADQEHERIAEEASAPPVARQPGPYREYFGLGLAAMLVALLARAVLARHRREAEVRALSGGYLSDAAEAMREQLPDWFMASMAATPQVEVGTFMPASTAPAVDPALAFLRKAPSFLNQLRDLLKETGRRTEPAGRQETLTAMHALLATVVSEAKGWSLRPVWQTSSAVELLVKRLLEKPKEVTPSTLRTLAAAFDVLQELCVPGIRPNLLVDPPLKVLAADDDALCRRAITFALQKASLTPDMAENGREALALATEQLYDVIFLDIQMPELDGLAACAGIRETRLNARTPVVFVTGQSDLQTRAQTTVMGGTDFIAKPFLMFEITVKVILSAVQRRLALQPKAGHAEVAADPALPVFARNCQLGTREGAAAVIGDNFTGDFHSQAPGHLAATQQLLQKIMLAEGAEREPLLDSAYVCLHRFTERAREEKQALVSLVAAGLEALLKKLRESPKHVGESPLNTAARALNLLARLCVPAHERAFAQQAPVRLLVVDDEPLARRAVTGALQLAFEKPDSAEGGAAALTMVGQRPYDIVFTDIEMPGMNGFELCERLRDSRMNADTPVVFITSRLDAESRAQALDCGGADFIGKPFLPVEITVKALTLAWERRLNTWEEAHNLKAPTAIPHVAAAEPVLAAN